MLASISRFCSRFPWLIIAVAALITVFMAYQIRENAYFEADMTKFMPQDIPAVKSDDYYKKNFIFQETMMIGLENPEGSIMEAPVLRAMEHIVADLKDLEASKTFVSQLTGKEETLIQPVGIDPDTVSSMANLEDAILDKTTGSVVSGSVIKKLKKDYGILSPPGKEEMLPESNPELQKIIPDLQKRILADRNFKDSLLSSDLTAASIRAAMVSKIDYKKRYAILELATAIDPASLTERFKGNDSTFQFNIYGKTIGKIFIDDAYIQKHSVAVRQELKSWLIDYFEVTFEEEPGLKDLLNEEFTASQFRSVMKYLERSDFFMHPEIPPWTKFISHIYDFMLWQIDPFSLENLEFQLHNVQNIYDLGEVYELTKEILNRHVPAGFNHYVAGHPVVIGVFTSMMSTDMGKMIPIAILVVLAVLAVSFRSVRGVLIPAVTVVLSVIWAMGIMAMFKFPFTVATSILPIILLAVGTAYGIHLLNRYYEDVSFSDDRKEVVQTSVKNVGVAIVMAAITTVVGFSSLASSNLAMIKHFGAFSAVGIGFALILTLTLTPALLVLWKLPRKKTFKNKDQLHEQGGLIIRFMRNWAQFVIKRPVTVFVVLGVAFLISCYLMTQNRFEGGMMSNFKKDNVMFLSDQFINKKLTGTTNINLIFKFRDQISLENPQAQIEFKNRLSQFGLSWKQVFNSHPEIDSRVLDRPINQLSKTQDLTSQGVETLITQIYLIRDVLNEEYYVEVAEPKNELGQTPEQSEAADEDEALDTLSDEDSANDLSDNSLDSLSDAADSASEDSDDELGGLADEGAEETSESGDLFAELGSDQILGLKDLNRRLGNREEQWQATGKMIVNLRNIKPSSDGIRLQRDFSLLQDFLAVDVKQPVVLHKLNDLYDQLIQMKEPEILINGDKYLPTGLVVTPVDFVRRFYRVFYHDDNPAYDRLPDVKKDGFTDPTLTDRSLIGVALNQALNASRDNFESMIKPDLKEFQVQVVIRNDNNQIIEQYIDLALKGLKEIFPADDPYIESILVGGAAPTGVAVTNIISESQLRSIVLSFLFVFIVTFFIFRSALGGLYSLIPLLFTVILNFGVINLLGGEITVGIMMVASISIGTGVDYTIHFLERLKIQLRAGDTLAEGYVNTVLTSGKAILMNASAVALGFLVLLFSEFVPNMMMGVLMAATMFFSSMGALTLLPAIILVTNPRFLNKAKIETN